MVRNCNPISVPGIRAWLNGTDGYVQTQPIARFVFVGLDGQALAWVETLDRLPFETSRHVTLRPFVGVAQYRVTLMA